MAIDRFDYLPSIDRPVIRWPNGARLAFWIAPNIGHYEYLPLPDKVRNYWPRMAHPDTKFYAHHDYGNRVGFWRLAEVFEQHIGSIWQRLPSFRANWKKPPRQVALPGRRRSGGSSFR